jgi:cell division protein FtsI (penicillin-binding protein 3)
VALVPEASPELVQAIEKLDLRGVGVQLEPVRRYPNGQLAAQLIGWVGREGIGLEGIEMTFERYLRAESGERTVVRDVRRRAMYQEAGSFVAPRDGSHVILTIDAFIQETVEREVARQVEHHKAESGLGIVMNPKTGEVLAMTSIPTFEPARGNKASPENRRNRTVTDPVEPGSIFKPFIMVTALAEGVTHPLEMIDCSRFPGSRRLHDHHAFGVLPAYKIVTRSSNIGMAIIGTRLGNKRMYEALKAFGFGGPTGIDLPGEGAGLLMPLRMWNRYTTSSVPMGHELAVTPIQIITAFSAIANGGRLLQPRVVRAVVDRKGDLIEDRSEVIDRGQAVDPAAAATMRDILIQVVVEGTGKRCDLEKWQVMGKTGTAQVPYKNRKGYEPGAYLASFIAAAPASDPELAVLVMIRKPKKNGYYGSQAALPAVKAILEESLTYLGVPSDKPAEPIELAFEDTTRP